MSILDVLTGGDSSKATDALDKARQAYENIPVPTTADLTLPQLQQYVDAGIMTPAEAKTALQESNAYNNIKLDPSSMEAEQKALGELSNVASDKGMTPEMQAQMTAALDQSQTQEHGANASILDQMAQRGIPTSLMAGAAEMANAGNEAQTNNLAATTAAGQAEQNAINAMMNEGNLAGTIHGQNYTEEANKAAAQNAINQWNAGATNTANLTNAGFTQAANAYNTGNKQNIANENTGLANQRTEYNATVPETEFNNQITKAGGIAGVDANQANLEQKQGQQNLDIFGGLASAGASLIPMGGGAPTAMGQGQAPPSYAPQSEFQLPGGSDGGLVMKSGGRVPGSPMVPGDSPKNDTVSARLSPGEVVIPRSIAPNPDAVKRFVQHLAHGKPPPRPVHPDDVHSVLEALTKRRAA